MIYSDRRNLRIKSGVILSHRDESKYCRELYCMKEREGEWQSATLKEFNEEKSDVINESHDSLGTFYIPMKFQAVLITLISNRRIDLK